MLSNFVSDRFQFDGPLGRVNCSPNYFFGVYIKHWRQSLRKNARLDLSGTEDSHLLLQSVRN